MMKLNQITLIIDSSNYTPRQIKYIYGEVENKKKNELNKLLDKAIELKDWHVINTLLDKYTTFMSC